MDSIGATFNPAANQRGSSPRQMPSRWSLFSSVPTVADATPKTKAQAHRGRDIGWSGCVITAPIVRRGRWLLIPTILRARVFIGDAPSEAQAQSAQGHSKYQPARILTRIHFVTMSVSAIGCRARRRVARTFFLKIF